MKKMHQSKILLGIPFSTQLFINSILFKGPKKKKIKKNLEINYFYNIKIYWTNRVNNGNQNNNNNNNK